MNLGYPEPPPGSRGEQLAAALAENYPSLEELEAGQNWANKFKRQPQAQAPPSSFYNMSRQQREEYYASRQPEEPSPSNNVNLLTAAGGISAYYNPELTQQGNITSRTVNGRGTVKFRRSGGARRKTRKPRS